MSTRPSRRVAVLPSDGLGKGAVNVKADDAHAFPSLARHKTGASGQHDIYGSALAAHPGKSQGAAI